MLCPLQRGSGVSGGDVMRWDCVCLLAHPLTRQLAALLSSLAAQCPSWAVMVLLCAPLMSQWIVVMSWCLPESLLV